MKQIFIFILFIGIAITSFAQNMVHNPGFEQLISCPNSLSQLDFQHVAEWEPATDGTPDYFNQCAVSQVSIPTNTFGFQNPFEGGAYSGIHTYGNDYREYILGNCDPLVIGRHYVVTIHANLSNIYAGGTDGLGVYFYKDAIGAATNVTTELLVTPQVTYSSYGPVGDTVNWTTLTSTFIADSAYTHLVIGSFKTDANTITLNNGNSFAYFYLDYISVISSFSTEATHTNVTCNGGSDGSATVTVINGTAPYAYLWTPGNQTTPTITGLTAGTYICRVTDAANDTARDTVVITQPAPALPPSINITSSSGDTICPNVPVTFTATIANGGNTPSYQWRKNGLPVGTNSPTYVDAGLNNGDAIRCKLTSNEPCLVIDTVLSNTITLYNTTTVPMISITVSPGAIICPGEGVTFTAATANGGNAPSYQWKKNGNNVGSNSPVFTDNTISNNDIVSCILTNSTGCVAYATSASNSITITVAASFTPAITITASPGTTVYPNEVVVFEAAITNGGLNPQYQWKKNGINVSTANPYITSSLANNDVITCSLLSNRACANPTTAQSNALVIHIRPAGINTLPGNDGLQLFPNPNTGTFTLKGIISGSKAEIEILNVIGQVVYKESIAAQNGELNKQITLPANHSEGIYLLKVQTDEGNEVIRFTITK